MSIKVETITNALSSLKEHSATLEIELNLADAKLGDGDTGTMLARFIEALNNCEVNQEDDLGAAFVKLAKAGSASTGSSFGTLLITGFLAAASQSKGLSEIDHKTFGSLLSIAVEKMLERGRASIGDKTAIDSIDTIAKIIMTSSEHDVKENVRITASQTLVEFRDQPCKIGRARMFADKSIGLDDPGMIAITRIAEIVVI